MGNNARVGIEIERKYVIMRPTEAELSKMPEYTKSEITQIYLSSEKGKTRRIRKRTKNGKAAYTETEKIRIDKMSSEETEREISKEEFDSLAREMKKNTRPIEKTRYTFVYEGQLFEIDVYPEWKKTAILETELDKRERKVAFPPIITILEDVTGNRAYSNASMSREFPRELLITCDISCPRV